MKKTDLWVLVLLIGVIIFVISLYKTGSPDINGIRYAGGIVSALGVALFVFDRLIWRWRILYPYLVSVPCIRGKWTGIGHIAVPPDATAKFEIEEVEVKQWHSALRMKIKFKDGMVSEFREKAPVVVTGNETITCGLIASYKNTAPGQAMTQRLAVMLFDAEDKFRHRPAQLAIHYSTTDRVIGTLEINKVK
jgi:SMODS-associating 2TM, beta-strand rich effector domain